MSSVSATIRPQSSQLDWEKVKEDILLILHAVDACRIQATEAVQEVRSLLNFDGVHKLLCPTAPALMQSIAKLLAASHRDPKAVLRSIETLIRRENDPI